MKVGVRVGVSVGVVVGVQAGVDVKVAVKGTAVGVARAEVWQARRKMTERNIRGSFERIRVSYPNIMGMAR